MDKPEILMCLHVAKLSRAGAAEIAGVSRATFFREMDRQGVLAPRSATKLDACSVQIIRRARRSGVSGKTLAQRFGVSPSTISRKGIL